MIDERICTVEELKVFICEILESCKKNRVFLLRGDLASGKTTFVQEFSKVLGLNVNVTSPTFSVQNSYDDKLYHYDIYQNGVEGFLSSGLLEELEKDGYHLIEWGNKKLENILKQYFINYLVIDIKKENKNSRIYKVSKCIN